VGIIEPRTYALKTGDMLVVRSAGAEDAGQIAHIKNAIIQKNIHPFL
jgi:hypothetical protein